MTNAIVCDPHADPIATLRTVAFVRERIGA